jgi:hypothetical protein
MTQIVTATVIKKSLYESDYLLWLQETIAKLRAREYDHLDFANLIEEIEDLGRSYRGELESRLDVPLSHILKRLYVPLVNDYNPTISRLFRTKNNIFEKMLRGITKLAFVYLRA